MHAEVDTCKKTDDEVARWSSASHAARLALIFTDWCTACVPQSILLLNLKRENLGEQRSQQVFSYAAGSVIITSPIVSKWARTYVAHARRSLRAHCMPLVVKASGSSFMAQGWIFLAWFRFTEPWSARDRCQRGAIRSERVQLRVKALMFV